MDLTRVDELIRPLDEQAGARAVAHWNAVAKPIGSLGVLEDDIVRIASITGTEQVRIDRRAVLAMCADNGVVAEGVTQTGQEVTALIARNMALDCSSVCAMAKVAGADVIPVDVGIAREVEGVVQRNVMRGTHDMAQGPAMSRAQAEQAVCVGIEMVRALKQRGYDVVVTGEMGIGNTTTSSAIVSVLLGVDPAEVTGRGAGLSDEGLARKLAAIRRAIEVNKPDPADALDVLSKVGGLDIAGMAGTFVGCAIERVPVLVDGFVSLAAALVATRIAPSCAPFMLATHCSAEPATQLVLDALGLEPPIHAGMRLGEGTGAVCLLPLLDMALALYNGTTFATTGMDAYEPEPS